MIPALDPSDTQTIRHAPIFSGLPLPAFQAMLTGATVKQVTRGETLFMQGDPVDYIYIVLDGWMKVFRITAAGAEAVVAVFTKGQSFAEAAAFTAGRFPASGEAVTDGRLLRVPSHALIRHVRENPDIGLAMLASTSMHLHSLVQQIEQLKAHTGAQRVAEFLWSLCDVDSGTCRIGLPYDKALIAGRLGMQPESLSRAFARLKPIGVHIEQNTAVIDNVEALRQYSNEDSALS
jgi:CRP-like cAMP-binding protein